MNSDTPQPSREEIEVRLTALLLGQLPPAEAELLRWSISQDPELAKLHDRLKSTIGMVREATASPLEATEKSGPPLKMSEERRQKLLAHFKTVAPKEFAPVLMKQNRKTSWLVPLAATLVISMVLAAMLLPALSSSKKAAMRVRELSMLRSQEVEAAQKMLPAPATPAPNPEPEAIVPSSNDAQRVELGPQPTATDQTKNANPFLSRSPVQLASHISLPPAQDEMALAPTPPPASPAPVVAPSPNSVAVSDLSESGIQPGRGFGGSGGGGGASGNAGVSMKLGDPYQGNSAGNRTGQPGGVYSQSVVGYVNIPLSATANSAQSEATAPADSERFYRELNSVPAAADKTRLPEAGKVATLAGKDVKNDGTFTFNPTISGATVPGAIVLPSDSAGEIPTPPTLSAGGSTFATQEKLGVTANGASAPATDSSDSGKLAYSTPRLYLNNDEVHTVDRLRRNTRKAHTIEANTQSASDFKDGTMQNGNRNGSMAVPNEPLVAMDSPTPAPVSTPPAAALPMDRFPSATSVNKVAGIEDDVTLAKQAAEVVTPQPEVFTKDNVFSTFSLNVSDVSYKLAAASLENEVMPAPETIRSEEFINAFDYRDPVPPAGTPVGFAWERAGDPFAHNRDFLRFSVTTAAQGRESGKALNLVLLLDKSGSMERADRVAIIQEALKVLAAQLKPHDKLSVITFARTARLYADGVSGKQATKVFGKVSKVTPQGGTNLEEAMNLAYQTALRHYLDNGVNRVVLLTDGAANLGDVDPQHLEKKVEKYRKQGVSIDCFGIGWEDYNDDLLEELASHGDGRYGFLNKPEEAASGFAAQLAGALKVAAADVKVQVEFNPQRVTAYRQIGYSKHQLTKEQFRDNSVNAAVIGAAESGNGLYTVQINPSGEGPVATVRVRFHTPGKNDYQERSWIVPYSGTAVALDQASPAMRLSATSGSFAEWLESSPYASEVNPEKLLEYLKGVPEVYGADARPQKLEWMIRQAKSILGKG